LGRIRLAEHETLPILRARVGDLAANVLVAGDPARVETMAQRLESPRRVGANREYVTYTGSYRGTPVSIMSHGVGAAGAATAFEELCRAGARRMLRVGTAGGMQPAVRAGSIVVAHAAIRADGLTERLIPTEYPAVADPGITLALRQVAGMAEVDVHTGIVLTAGNFYPSPVLANDQHMWQEAGAIAVEMEVAALLTVASLNQVAAGAVLAIDGNPLANVDEAMTGYQPFQHVVDQAVDASIHAGLEAIVASEQTTRHGPHDGTR